MIEALLLDVDGTVLDGTAAVPGSAAAIERLRARGLPLLFATNTSRMSQADVAASLARAGVAAEPREILSAGVVAAARLRELGLRRVHPLLAPSALADFADFELTSDGADAVVVGDMGSLFTFDVLNAAFLTLRGGARLLACQKNRFWKSERGIRMDAGGFVAALEYAGGVTAEVVGKPEPAFFAAAERLLGKPAARLAIVGDGLDNDVAGGKAAGLTTVLVRTGLYDEERLQKTPPRDRPDHVIDSIAELPALLATF